MQCSKSFSLEIEEGGACLITDGSVLPEATAWEFYTYQLNTSGGTPPFTFALIAGTIAGGSVSSSGLIDSEIHNPNILPITSNFTIRATDSSAEPITCDKAFSLTTVHAEDCPNWASLAWDPGAPIFTPDNTTGAAFSGSCSGIAGGTHNGGMVFNSPEGCTLSELQWTWNLDAVGGSANVTIASTLGGTLVNRGKVAGSSGSETIKFGIRPGNQTITVSLSVNSGGGSSNMAGSLVNT